MYEKESVNFFYYLNPMQIKNIKKRQVSNNLRTDSQGDETNKIKRIAYLRLLIKEFIDT